EQMVRRGGGVATAAPPRATPTLTAPLPPRPPLLHAKPPNLGSGQRPRLETPAAAPAPAPPTAPADQAPAAPAAPVVPPAEVPQPAAEIPAAAPVPAPATPEVVPVPQPSVVSAPVKPVEVAPAA